MYKVIDKYIENISLVSNEEIYHTFSDFLENCEENLINKYSISVSSNIYVIDVRLKEYSVESAKKFFENFNRAVSYPYSALHVRFNEGKCVRYRYITCKEDKEGFYCDIVIS